MAPAKLVLACPYCHWVFEAKSPDDMHTACSFSKSVFQGFHGKLIERNLVCQNPKCNKRLRIYWYATVNYFSRI